MSSGQYSDARPTGQGRSLTTHWVARGQEGSAAAEQGREDFQVMNAEWAPPDELEERLPPRGNSHSFLTRLSRRFGWA